MCSRLQVTYTTCAAQLQVRFIKASQLWHLIQFNSYHFFLQSHKTSIIAISFTMISRTVDALIHAFSYSGSIFAAIRASETISKPPSKTKKRSKHPITPSTTRYQSGFEVRPSSLGGFGAFATRHLTKDEVILVESPLLRANHSTVLRNYNQLPRADRKAAQQLHAGPHFKEGTIHIEKVWYTNW